MAAVTKKQQKDDTKKSRTGSVLLTISMILIVLIAIVLQKPHPDLDWDNRFLPLAQRYMDRPNEETTRVFEGLLVLITGATSGIGKALTLLLTSKVATVIATGRSMGKLDDLVSSVSEGSTGMLVVPIVVELSDLTAVSKAKQPMKLSRNSKRLMSCSTMRVCIT